MFFKKKDSIIAAVFLLLLVNCEMIVDVDLPAYKPVLVVNSFFSPETEWIVRVNHSKAILDTSAIQPIENARVEISSGGMAWRLSRNFDGYYYSISALLPLTGKKYTVHVSAPGYESVSASSIVPAVVPIESIATRRFRKAFGADELEIAVNFTDPPEESNYYQLVLSSQEIMSIDAKYYEYESDDLVFRRGWGTVFTDDLFSGKSYSLKIRLRRWSITGTTLWVNLVSITPEYYKYFKSYHQFENQYENPFAEPVFVYNNITNGLGVFAGFNAAKQEIRVWPISYSGSIKLRSPRVSRFRKMPRNSF